MMKNPDSHLFLYAKMHYQQSHYLMEDLRKICAHRCSVDKKFLVNSHIADVLLEVALPYIKKSDYSLKAFIYGLNENRSNSYYNTRLIKLCLNELMRAKVHDSEGNIILELDDPDPNILPLSEKAPIWNLEITSD
jgi:hypothetical protein